MITVTIEGDELLKAARERAENLMPGYAATEAQLIKSAAQVKVVMQDVESAGSEEPDAPEDGPELSVQEGKGKGAAPKS
tara:strand:+ start:9209 stop:9445 length:237 start_codon:yes stop_codon:yes gene_type:complete